MMAYLAVLAIVAGVSLLNCDTRRIGGLLIVGQVIFSTIVQVTGKYDAWQAYALFDLFAAWLVLREPANRLSAMFGSTCIMALIADLGFGIAQSQSYWTELLFGPAPGGVSLSAYLSTLQTIAWLQLGLVGAWHVSGGIRRVAYSLVPRWRSADRPPDHSSVSPWGS